MLFSYLLQVNPMKLIVSFAALVLLCDPVWSQDDPFGGGSGAADPFVASPPAAANQAAQAGPFGNTNPSNAREPTDSTQPRSAKPKSRVADPFAAKPSQMMEMAAGLGMEADMGEMGGMAMEYEEGYGDAGPSPDDAFRFGVQRAIKALRQAKSAEDKAALHSFVRKAFSDRYDEIIKARKQKLDDLKQRIANLEQELVRRAQAKDRVVALQLQSVQLAAEGLLDLKDLGLPGPSDEMGMGAPGMGDMGSMMGGQ
jgi:hypothetical protein